MKKILSLALALLMMIPLTVGASAANVNYVGTAEDFRDVLEYWSWINNGKGDYEDYLDYLDRYDGIDREWTNYCENEECGAWGAFFYVSNGRIYYSCRTCGKTGESKLTSSDKTCFKCNCSDCDISKDECPCDCKKCNCTKADDDDDDIDSGMQIPWDDEINGMFNHGSKYCELSDVDIRWYDGKAYWYCDNCERYGRLGSSYWGDDYWYDYFWDYTVRVSCSRGGSYEIDGSKYVHHGDTRKITFDPNYGYVLYNVTVNGVDYGNAETLSITVTDDIYVEAEFVKASSLKPCDLTASAIGNGTITAKKNGVKVAADEITVNFFDTVTYKFTPASSGYVIKNVTVNGRSIGKVSSYTVGKGITKDIDIKVTFEWKNPYDDIENENYLKAVEYVTEAGIMGYYNKYVNKNAFCGTTAITVRNLAAALAEMADVSEKLDTVEERLAWAEKNGIIDSETKLADSCKVQTACDIVDKFLTVLETEGDVSFEDFDADDTAKENALSIGLVSSTTYTNNRTLSRYDLAAICYLIANLDVE